jgi:hypothetical protein
MHKQAATVVLIGVFACIALICLISELKTAKEVLDNMGPGAGFSKQMVAVVASLELMPFVACVLCFVEIGLLTVCLFRVSHRHFRIWYRTPPSRDPLEVLYRVTPGQTPFQFGILTLLALMLVVALVCTALKIVGTPW